MAQRSLDKHVHATYFTLRIGIAIIAVAFPLILYFGGRLHAGLPLQDSMSAYYHASQAGKSMRDWFVGVLFAVGVFLYLYKGYSNKENYALNIAGILAVGIAVFPMQWQCGDSCSGFSIHGFCAVLFFFCISFVAIKCAPETLRLIPDPQIRDRYRSLYRILAATMALSPVAAFVVNFISRQRAPLVFWIEAFGIAAFAAYWLTKSRELSLTCAEERALKGELNFLSGTDS